MKHNGSTLIELLIAFLIFSIGLLGLMRTQNLALRYTQKNLHLAQKAQREFNNLVDHA